jgi:hypothetical protein
MNCANDLCYWNYEGTCCTDSEEAFHCATPDQLDCPSSLRKDFEEQLNAIHDACVALLYKRNMRELTEIKKFIESQRS